MELEMDPDKGGDETLLALQQEYGKLPETVEVLTGGGGRHLYFRHPGVRIKSTQGVFGDDASTGSLGLLYHLMCSRSSSNCVRPIACASLVASTAFHTRLLGLHLRTQPIGLVQEMGLMAFNNPRG